MAVSSIWQIGCAGHFGTALHLAGIALVRPAVAEAYEAKCIRRCSQVRHSSLLLRDRHALQLAPRRRSERAMLQFVFPECAACITRCGTACHDAIVDWDAHFEVSTDWDVGIAIIRVRIVAWAIVGPASGGGFLLGLDRRRAFRRLGLGLGVGRHRISCGRYRARHVDGRRCSRGCVRSARLVSLGLDAATGEQS